MRILADLPELTGVAAAIAVDALTAKAFEAFADEPGRAEAIPALAVFLRERVASVFEQRGADVRNVRAVMAGDAGLVPLTIRRRLDVLPEFTDTVEFKQLAVLFKRVRNIAKQLPEDRFRAIEAAGGALSALTEPAELALRDEISRRTPAIQHAVDAGDGYRKAFGEAAAFGPAVATFFDDVMVMADDPAVREARLGLLRRLESLILQLADISEMVPQSDS